VGTFVADDPLPPMRAVKRKPTPRAPGALVVQRGPLRRSGSLDA
jgi:hypothetical protein